MLKYLNFQMHIHVYFAFLIHVLWIVCVQSFIKCLFWQLTFHWIENQSEHLFFIVAYKYRSHTSQQEDVHLSLEGMQSGGETVQGSVHVGGAHEAPHRGETSQVHSMLYFYNPTSRKMRK